MRAFSTTILALAALAAGVSAHMKRDPTAIESAICALVPFCTSTLTSTSTTTTTSTPPVTTITVVNTITSIATATTTTSFCGTIFTCGTDKYNVTGCCTQVGGGSATFPAFGCTYSTGSAGACAAPTQGVCCGDLLRRQAECSAAVYPTAA